jgi:mannosyltransferase
VTVLAKRTPSAGTESARMSSSRLLPPVLVGLFGMLLPAAYSWMPSLWFDEAATVSSTSRSIPQLFAMLGSIDAVHGAYYVAMHLWFDLVGYSPFTLRFPSAIAVGVAAALIVMLVRTLGSADLGSTRLAVIAGIVFCLLPRITWAGSEGRSYALTTVLATSMTLVLVAAMRRSGAGRLAVARVAAARWWALYGVVVIVSTTTFLYLSLLVVAHGVTVIFAVARSRLPRSAVIGWAAATLAAGLVLIPFARLAVGQSGQVQWIGPIDVETWHGVFAAQWFYGNDAFAILGWGAIIAGVAVLSARGRGLRSARADATSGALSLLLPWLIVPPVLLIAASLVGSPLYSARYLTFCAPAVAIVMAAAIDALGRRWLVVAALALCVVVTAPTYVSQRGQQAKQNTAWSQVASLVAAERSPDIRTAIIWGPLRHHVDATSRVIEYSYPDAFTDTIDVSLRMPAAETGQLWETRYPLADVTSRLDGVAEVWLITGDTPDWRPKVTATLDALGYHVDAQWLFSGTTVLRYSRRATYLTS